MKLTLTITLFGLLMAITARAQTVEGVITPNDKKQIEIRPSSRDYGAVRRDNLNQRVDRQRDKDLFVKKRPVIHRKFIKPGNEKDPRLHRRQRLIQRRTLNR